MGGTLLHQNIILLVGLHLNASCHLQYTSWLLTLGGLLGFRIKAASGLGLLPEAMSGFVILFQLKSVLMSMTYIAQIHGNAQNLS